MKNSQIQHRQRLPVRDAIQAGAFAIAAVVLSRTVCAAPSTPPAEPGPAAGQPPQVETAARMYIREYRVLGARDFPRVEVEEAVYPFLGPARTEQDIEAARAALENAYHAKGLESAVVSVPPQQGRGGIIFLQVTEGRLGQVRVKGARYFLPSDIRAKARSLAEGRAVNYKDVARDLVALNQLPDRTVTPSLRPGAEPGTVDVDLNVVDKFPLHASLELNNRRSPDTTPLRLNGSASYNNLWQAGHSIGASFQISPQELDEVKVFSGYYIWRFQNLDWLSLSFQGTKSDSNVNTLGGLATIGRGETFGLRAVVTLPPGKDFYQSLNFGVDYKRTRQLTLPQRVEDDINNAGAGDELNALLSQNVTYYPVTALYSATWAPKGAVTELNLGVTFGIRGVGGRRRDFEQFRYDADANFIYLRGDLSHTHDLPRGFELYGKVEGQVSDQPLINAEQFSGGGLGTVRGYLEAEVQGDNAIVGNLELRSPSLLGWMPEKFGKENDWRVYVFGDAGYLTLHSPLPEQNSKFRLASFGVGSRLQLFEHFNGSIDLAFPTISQTYTRAGDPHLIFRVWADF